MMLFSTGTGLERVGIVGPARWIWTLRSPAKSNKQRGSAGARPLSLRCLSQSFPVERKDQLLRGRMFCIPFTDGVAWYL